MTAKFRADVLGSLLRPAYLAEARQKCEAGDMPVEEFRQLEDRAVDEAIALQEGAGVDVVTDGEMRRFTFFDQFAAAVEGVAHEEGEAVPFHSEPGKVDIDFHSPVSVTDKVRRKQMITPDEFEYAHARATKPVKVTLPSPLMFFTMWSPKHSTAAYNDPFELFADGVDLVLEEAQRARGPGLRVHPDRRARLRPARGGLGARALGAARHPGRAA